MSPKLQLRLPAFANTHPAIFLDHRRPLIPSFRPASVPYIHPMSPDTPRARNSILSSKWLIGLVIALVLGAVFRFAWPQDIEYKLDEYYTFSKTKVFFYGGREYLPDTGPRWLGMPTSKGFKNTGMSLWIFYAIGSVSGASTPPALARGVQVCNVAALLLLLLFASRSLAGREREWWLWTVALACLNPFHVLFERKIWPPCALPLIMVLFLASWRARSKRHGAFFWGLLGILAGQIHMAGFFYAAAFILWAAIYDRARVAWRWWLAGNLLGVVPMLPWIFYMAAARNHAAEQATSAFIQWWRPFGNHFWLDWITEPFGLGMEYSGGRDFQLPLFGGHASPMMALLLYAAILLCGWLLGAGLLRWWKGRGNRLASKSAEQPPFTSSVLQAGFWLFGILFTVSCMRFERHYLIVAFPLMALWVARLALPIDATERQWEIGRRLLLAVCVTNALITFAFLDFIHVNGGAPDADFGKSYARQKLDGASDDIPPIRWNQAGP